MTRRWISDRGQVILRENLQDYEVLISHASPAELRELRQAIDEALGDRSHEACRITPAAAIAGMYARVQPEGDRA